jgi:hypothetical protein
MGVGEMANELRCTRRVKVKGKKQICNELANEYEVSLAAGGRTFAARETLCVKHKLAAATGGYTLKAVEPEK